MMWVAPDYTFGCSPSKLGWNRLKSYCYLYGCSKLRLTTGVLLALGHDEFRGPRSDTSAKLSRKNRKNSGGMRSDKKEREKDDDQAEAKSVQWESDDYQAEAKSFRG
ncbi:hypothetical protein TNCV_2794091 [Trichonephila clavipes]|nr:hypothetical protein TNCV_2794091 [Trichonephila clavipes]